MFRVNCRRGHDLRRRLANDKAMNARKKDAAEPIPEAAYMQRVKAIAETMPPWLARACTASRREAAGIREL